MSSAKGIHHGTSTEEDYPQGHHCKSSTAKFEVAAAPKQTQVNSHIEAGISFQALVRPPLEREPQTLVMLVVVDATARQRSVRSGDYGNKKFQPRGFDNGILRDLVGAGLITLSGGQKQVIDGKEYMVDGASAVQVTLTAAGMSYGKPKTT